MTTKEATAGRTGTMTRQEMIAEFAVKMAVAQMADDDGEAMFKVVNDLLDAAEERGRQEARGWCLRCCHRGVVGHPDGDRVVCLDCGERV